MKLLNEKKEAGEREHISFVHFKIYSSTHLTWHDTEHTHTKGKFTSKLPFSRKITFGTISLTAPYVNCNAAKSNFT